MAWPRKPHGQSAVGEGPDAGRLVVCTGFAPSPVFFLPISEARNHNSSGNGDLLTECRNIAVFTDRACCGFRPFRDELLIKFGICPFYRASKWVRN